LYDFPEIDFLDRRLASHTARGIRRLTKGPMRRERPRFGVVRFEPHEAGRPELLVTTAVARGRHRRSFVCVTRDFSGHLAEVMTAIAWWHMQPHVRALTAGTIMPIGRPWAPGNERTHVLVSEPFLFGERWRDVTLPEQSWDVLWAQPVSEEDLLTLEYDRDTWLHDRAVEARVHMAMGRGAVPEA
jgi:hypothetical protein